MYIIKNNENNIYMKKRFAIYGLIGWLIEVMWTGLGSLIRMDAKLQCYTSIWMFPIYGMVAFFEPICEKMKKLNIFFRGGIYTICIFTVEYITGYALKKIIGVCPWDYSGTPFSVNGIIRLDYAPVWFGAGLFFEKVHNLVYKFK